MEMLLSVLPLAIASAVVPIQIVITVLLLRAPGGTWTAAAWVGGMASIRLIQGLVFGIILDRGGQTTETGPTLMRSLLLLVVAILLYVSAAKQLTKQPDEDAPPPRWMVLFDGVRPARAYLMGAGLILLGPKFWAFTLGAIAVVEAAELGDIAAVAWYLVFVALAATIHLLLLGVAVLAPTRSAVLLERVGTLLERYSRAIMVTIGVVFGTWFLAQALQGLGTW